MSKVEIMGFACYLGDETLPFWGLIKKGRYLDILKNMVPNLASFSNNSQSQVIVIITNNQGMITQVPSQYWECYFHCSPMWSSPSLNGNTTSFYILPCKYIQQKRKKSNRKSIIPLCFLCLDSTTYIYYTKKYRNLL
jgi:hypothetical protein